MTNPTEIAALRQKAASQVISLGEAAPFAIETNPMDEDWKQRFDEAHPTHDVLPAAREGKMRASERAGIAGKRLHLLQGLLKFGGERVLLPAWEGDLDDIIDRGQLFDPRNLVLKRGDPNRCHQNAAGLWRRSPDTYLVATGYYLSKDGMWRQHSWCIEPRKKMPRVVETTVPAVAYFGFVMTDAEARKFYEDVDADLF